MFITYYSTKFDLFPYLNDTNKYHFEYRRKFESGIKTNSFPINLRLYSGLVFVHIFDDLDAAAGLGENKDLSLAHRTEENSR